MRGIKFSLRSLLIGVTYVAIGCVALAKRTELWTSVVVTGTVGTLFVGAIVAIHTRGRARAFAAGLAIAGFGYLAMIHTPGIADTIAPHLATSKLLDWANRAIHGEAAPDVSIAFSPNGKWLATSSGRTVRLWNSRTGQWPNVRSIFFQQIGHCLCALFMGWLGGILAQMCHARMTFPSPGD